MSVMSVMSVVSGVVCLWFGCIVVVLVLVLVLVLNKRRGIPPSNPKRKEYFIEGGELGRSYLQKVLYF